jgi:hypothetical protein
MQAQWYCVSCVRGNQRLYLTAKFIGKDKKVFFGLKAERQEELLYSNSKPGALSEMLAR